LPTYTYPDPKDGVQPAFVVTQVFIFETVQWISMEFGVDGLKKKLWGQFLEMVHSLFGFCPSSSV
jgi:hypothetical protein